MDNFLYLAYDGDYAGRLVGRAILANDVEELHEVSARINLGHEIVHQWVTEHGGEVISGGGDEGLFQLPVEALESIEQLRADYKFVTNLTMSVGVGSSLSEAGKSLLVAKFRGKDQVVQYSPEVENEVKSASDRVSQGTASDEERKLGEAYLKPEGSDKMENSELQDCQYCKDMEQENPDHCEYCHDMEQEDDCQYCQEADAAAQDHEHSGDDCEYCKDMEDKAPEAEAAPEQDQVEATAGPNVNEPTTTSSENFADEKMNPPEISKPDPSSEPPIGLGVSNDEPSNSNDAIEDTMNYEKESSDEIAQLLSTDGNPDAMDHIDDTDLAVGTEMEDNVSRPEMYDENVPADMGLSEENEEENPDLTEVLKDGLDSHADNIQKEKVMQMVGQALDGFKASKDVLEKAKEQAPQLYDASLMMIKAMIEMAKMLGFTPKESPVEAAPEEATAEEAPAPQEDSQAAVQEDAAQAPKAQMP